MRLKKGGGMLTVALYLKQCSSSLMIAYGGDHRPHGLLPHPVSLTRRGMPRIIPAFHRHMIRAHDSKADLLVKWYLSLFSLYRIILLATRVRKSTFSSLVTPVDNISRTVGLVGSMKDHVPMLFARYVPRLRSIPLHQGMVWEPTWKTVPTMALANRELAKHHAGTGSRWSGPVRSFFPALMFEMASYASVLQFIHAQGQQWSSGVLWPHRVRYALDKLNEHFTNTDLEEFERRIGPFLPTSEQLGLPMVTGRLGQTIQQGTKRRLFSMGNYINQRLLHPLHQWCASVLKMIPMEGTFNQRKRNHSRNLIREEEERS